MIHAGYDLALRARELEYLLFDKVKKSKKTGYKWMVYQPKTGRWKPMSISENLYNEVILYK